MSLHGRRLLLLNGRRAPSTRAFSPWSASYPTPLHAVWAGDPAWSNPGDGNAVSSWRNESGGGDPAQATGTAQPTYRASTAAFNGRPTVQSDGGDWLFVNIAGVVEPWKMVVVAAGPTTANRRWVNIDSSFRGFGVGGGSEWTFRSSLGSLLGAAADINPHVFVVAADNATSSALFVDDVEQDSGNPGAQSIINWTLFAQFGGSGAIAGHIAYVGIYSGADDLTDLVAALGDHYSITIA